MSVSCVTHVYKAQPSIAAMCNSWFSSLRSSLVLCESSSREGWSDLSLDIICVTLPPASLARWLGAECIAPLRQRASRTTRVVRGAVHRSE
jgi:hypothetical protein